MDGQEINFLLRIPSATHFACFLLEGFIPVPLSFPVYRRRNRGSENLSTLLKVKHIREDPGLEPCLSEFKVSSLRGGRKKMRQKKAVVENRFQERVRCEEPHAFQGRVGGPCAT